MYIPSEANNRTYCHDCILPKQKIKNVSWRKPSVMKSSLNKNLKPAQHRLQKILPEGKRIDKNLTSPQITHCVKRK